ncbi:DUF2845 domain-containing protein [Piscinibacter sp. HJYY11]|uniref:DUF2845 domain-containing protein n=1 Tax=Piscinibacter sp. HJYY11 TaxID=2801333 RepID=UPI00192003CB|nr:DUF2845 domain-containing protein [Piscinibacter sp. HJYY11]MBL0728823.1 DUF2845 domain-containing protein [Piscinibacter sp. HJYY11]
MKPTRALATLCITTAVLAPWSAQAQSMRCKNDLANVGEGKASVLQKCGEPVHRESFCKPVAPTQETTGGAGGRTIVNVTPCETVDEWTYNPGRGQFMTMLRFESGRLTAITYGDRVK